MKKYLDLETVAPNQELYHYTKCSSLMNILKTEKFYATKSSFLNDTNETDYIASVAEEAIAEIEQKSWRKLLTKHIIDTIADFKRHDTFVLSFSLDRDSITLWSEFGEQTGYDVGFNGQELIGRIAKRQKIYCHGRVIYDYDEQKQKILYLLREELPAKAEVGFPELMQHAVENPEAAPFLKLKKRVQKALNSYAMFFKQEEFAAENEYRIVFRNPDKKKIKFREKDGFLLPFIEINLASGQKGQKMPIHSVTVAPKNHVDLAKKGMRQYLDFLGYDVPVELSRLKLRY